ncbi:Trace amine-associated receptor 5 [Trichoplax sp. H2]|nr:Trace amine-associated receptor 5 [Trichoplax sp. H2]|eukprot:RDD39413.1 Trace amine-associated receptor 5 [Trichoplax sp. H2]
MENTTIDIDEDINQTTVDYFITQFPNSTFCPSLQAILNILHVIISGLTIFINLSIFLIIICRKRLRKWNNFYLCGMFLAATGTATANIIHKVLFKMDLILVFQQGFIAVFNYLIAVVTFNRFLRVCEPIRYKSIMTKTVIASATLSCYLFCFIIPIVDFILRHFLQNPMDALLVRMLNWLLVCHIYILPCACTIFLYIRIVMIVFSRAQFLNQISLYHATRCKTNMKSFQQLALIVTLYILCWLPYCICYLVLSRSPSQIAETTSIINILVLLIFFHQAINPILYVALTTTIKDEVIDIAYNPHGRYPRSRSNRKTFTSSGKGETVSTTTNCEAHPHRIHDIREVTHF